MSRSSGDVDRGVVCIGRKERRQGGTTPSLLKGRSTVLNFVHLRGNLLKRSRCPRLTRQGPYCPESRDRSGDESQVHRCPTGPQNKPRSGRRRGSSGWRGPDTRQGQNRSRQGRLRKGRRLPKILIHRVFTPGPYSGRVGPGPYRRWGHKSVREWSINVSRTVRGLRKICHFLFLCREGSPPNLR